MRFVIVPDRSRVTIDARSSVHPIHTNTDGLQGFVELGPSPRGELSLPVERLRSGNPLEDRELRRRIDAKRYPTIDGRLTEMHESGEPGRYRVRGDITFRGVTRACEDDMMVEHVDEQTVQLAGSSTFDIREFGMDPPRILMLRVEPEVRVSVLIVAETPAP